MTSRDIPRRWHRDAPGSSWACSAPASNLWILAWDPDEARTVTLSLPLWMLRLGKRNVSVGHEADGFDLERLQLDVDELSRVGPALIFDFRNSDGVRVLLWTE